MHYPYTNHDRKLLSRWIFSILLMSALVPSLCSASTTTPETLAQVKTSTSTLLFLGNENRAPIFFSKDGTPTGLAVDITQALAKHISTPIILKAVDWTEAQKLVADGDADALVYINSTDIRKNIYDFSDPLLNSQISIFTNAATKGITDIASLGGLHVGVEKESLPEKMLGADPKIILYKVQNIADAFQQLTNGALDAVVVDYRIGAYILAEKNIQNIVVAGSPLTIVYPTYAVKKGNTALLNEINTALQTIKSDGTYQAILNNWKPEEVVFRTQAQIARQTTVMLFIAIIFLLLIMTVWTIIVNKELQKRKKVELEAKEAEISLSKIEERFERSLETARDGVIIIDAKEKIIFWNKAAEIIFGYTREEVIGKGLHALLARPQEQKLFAERFPHFQETGEGPIVGKVRELTALRKNGEEFPLELSVSANYLEGQWFATGIVRDVTERKKSEDALRKSESLLGTLIDTIPLPVFFKDRVGRYLGFNKAYETFFGAKKEELIGKTVFDINPPELAVIYNAKDDELFQGGGEQKYSSQVKSLNKGLRDVIFNKAVFTDEQGSPAGLVGAILDVTEDRNFQRKIELSNTILKTEQEASLDAILTVDENEKITSCNQKFVSMFHLSPEMVAAGIDEPVLQAVTEQNKNPEAFLEKVKYLNAHHDEKSRDEMTMKDGRVIDRYSAPLIDEEGVYHGRVWTFRDITESKHAEEEHRANAKYMESMDKINNAILKTNNLEEMMRDVLDVVLAVFDCDRAWLITPCDPWTLSYRVPMERTKAEWPGASTLGIEVPVDPDTTILFQKTRASDGPVEFNSGTDPILPPELTERFHIQSQLVMEIHPKVPDSWMVGMHQCSYERVWTDGEKKLFQEVGRRIADALSTLLTYRELQEREKEYSRIVTTATEGIMVIDEEQKFTFVNPRMIELLGYPEGELLGHRFSEFVLSEEMSDHEHQMDLRRKGEATIYERRFHRKDGSVIWCSVSGTPIFDEKHEFNGSFGMVNDITERKKIEEELRGSEEKFSVAFQVSPSLIAITRLSDGMIFEINDGFAQMLGYTREEAIRKTIPELAIWANPSDRDIMVSNIKEYGHFSNFETTLRRKDGTIITALYSAKAFKLNNEDCILSVAYDITERKKAEDELRESEAKFSAAFQASPSLIAITRLSDGKIIEVNDGYSQMLGYSREESIGKTTSELAIWANPEDRKIFSSKLKEFGQFSNFETTLRRKDGDIITVIDSARTIKIDNEDCTLSVAYNITERKRAEDNLMEQEKHSQSLLRFSRRVEQSQTYGEVLMAAQEEIKTIIGYTNVWAYRVDEKKEYAHSIVATGSTAGAVMSEGGSATLKIPGDPMLEAIANAKEIVVVEDAQTDPNVNREIVKKLGNRTIVNVPIVLFDRNLGSIGMGTFGDEGVRVPTASQQEYLIAMASHMAVAFDRIRLLTERKKTLETLKENEKALEEAQRIGNFGSYEWNTITNEAVWSQEFYRIYGIDPSKKAPALEEYIKLHTPESVEILKKSIKTLGQDEPYGIDLEFIRANDGSRRWINLRSEAKFDEKHNLIGVRGIAQDITKAKEVEKMRMDFLSLASHQLRTPLSGTRWLIETLEKGLPGPLTQGQHEYLEEIHRINDRMTRLVSDMLSALRIESIEASLIRTPISVQQLFTDLMLSVGATAKSKKIKVHNKATGHNIPHIESDANFLSIVLGSLLSNAINYSPNGSEVIFDVKKEDDEVIFTVQDFGIGIPEDEQIHLFERFFRATNAKIMRPEGTGLVLYIATTVASKLGGTITFTSTPGKGSTFSLHLPSSNTGIASD